MLGVARVDAALRAAGIPIDGVGDNGDGTYRIDFKSTATAAQRSNATTIVAGADKKATVPRATSAIMADLAGLSAADRNSLISSALSWYLQSVPGAALALGINVSGEQDVT